MTKEEQDKKLMQECKELIEKIDTIPQRHKPIPFQKRRLIKAMNLIWEVVHDIQAGIDYENYKK